MNKLTRTTILILLVLISVFPMGGVFAQGDDTQIRVTQVDNAQFPQVTVYLSATNAAGEPVGIDPATIQIYENGVLMTPENVQGGGVQVGEEPVPVTTMLVIDISGSMDKNDKIGAAKNAAKAYISQMRPGDQAGLIAYDTNVYNVQPITTDTSALTSAIDNLQTGSDTAMYDALVEAEKAVETVTGRKAIIVLSDGLDNQSRSNAEDVIAGVGQSGVTISAIGFGDVATTGQTGLDEEALKSLADRTGGVYGFATAPAELQSLYEQQGRVLQSEYQFTYVSPSVLRDGVNRNLTVSLTTAAVPAVESKYNPGGVLPEVVSGGSWTLFFVILFGLLALLFIPMLVSFGARALGGMKGKSGAQSFGRTHQPAKGRIKLK
ncbi:MAG TPA: VWA domain-containing protein [Anaerolineales bacterium]|nr:VWA domain-containing protein [Anaerolineales bacterium]